MAGEGMRIYGLGSKNWVFGNFSRYIKYFHSPDSLTQSEELYEFIVKLSRGEEKKPIIFPTRDHDVLFLDRFRDKLKPYVIIPQPSKEVINTVLNKWELYKVARKLDIPVPETFYISSEKDLNLILSKLNYPVLLKPVYAADWRKDEIWEKVRQKVIFMKSDKELKYEYNKISCLRPTALIQEYIEGGDNSIYTYCSYCNKELNILASFNTRKILQVPERLGTGVIVQSTINNDIKVKSELLLKHIGYFGISEIEYKRNPYTGDYYLIEINPRLWDQHILSQSFGINLPLIVYNDLTKKKYQKIRLGLRKLLGLLSYLLLIIYYDHC